MAQGKFTTSPTPSNIVSAVNAMVDDIAGKAASNHNHSASNITSGTLAVARGGTGVTANPSMLTNLGSTSAASVFAASPRPGVTGTLPIANGGTGATTKAAAQTNLGLNDAIVGLSVSGKTITYTQADGGTGTITTQDTNTTYSVATQSANGLMSASDKKKLDGINSDVFSKGYITETYISGKSRYRRWSDGTLEQWGFATSNTITLHQAYANTDYNIQMSAYWSGDKYNLNSVTSITTTKFTIYNYSGNKMFWYTIGLGA